MTTKFDQLIENYMSNAKRGKEFGMAGAGKAGAMPNKKDKKKKAKGKHGSRAEGKKQAQDY